MAEVKVAATPNTSVSADPATAIKSVSADPTTAIKAGSVATAATASEPPVDLVRMLDKTADAVHTMWVGILRKYRLARSHATDAFSDSKILLRHISTAWVGLGKQMLRDAHSPDTPKGRFVLALCYRAVLLCCTTVLYYRAVPPCYTTVCCSLVDPRG
jgi:hypothetical protein